MREHREISDAVASLLECQQDITNKEEKQEISVMVSILLFYKTPDDFKGRYKKAAIRALKFMNNEAPVDILFE